MKRAGIHLDHRTWRRRRGAAYVAVLGMAMMMVTVGIAAVTAARSQLRRSEGSGDAAEARILARSGVELARLWIKQDANWRTNRPNGVWASNVVLGKGSVTVEVVDPADGNLADDPYQPVLVTVTGVKGQARQKVQVTLAADPVPLPVLRYAIHTAGQFHIRSGKQVYFGAGTGSTNGNLRNDGTIIGNMECLLGLPAGTVTGKLSIASPAKAFPDANVPEWYAALGTQISPGNTIDKKVLAPGYNPWGAANALGVYVIRADSDLTIKNTRINGTLVIINPGKKVTIDGSVSFAPYRTDFPVLIVKGDVVLQFDSQGAPLSESTAGVNFNPAGAPWQGNADTDLADQYPSEIRGLVHVTGTITLNHDGVIRGAVICESAALADAVDIGDDREIFYDPKLYTNPPRWYTTSVPMKVLAGSWKQVVD